MYLFFVLNHLFKIGYKLINTTQHMMGLLSGVLGIVFFV